MSLSPEEQKLRDQFFKAMMEAAQKHQPGSDPEVTLEALIEAAQMLQGRLQQELAELRQEQAE